MKNKLKVILGVIVSILIGGALVGLISNINFKDENKKEENKNLIQEQEKEQDVFDILNNDNLNEYEYGIDGESAKYYLVKNTNCNFGDVLYADGKKFITNIDEEYYIYEYHIDKKYSDETNCKLIEKLNKKPKYVSYGHYESSYSNGTYKMSYGKFILYEDMSFADYSTPNTTKLKLVNEYKIFDWLNSDSSFQIRDLEGSIGTVWIVDKHSIYKVDSNSNKEYFLQLPEDETILKYLDQVIVTNKSIYFYGVSDYSCMDYVDKECKKEYIKNMDLTNRYEDIAFINNLYIVFKDGNTFMYNLKYYE